MKRTLNRLLGTALPGRIEVSPACLTTRRPTLLRDALVAASLLAAAASSTQAGEVLFVSDSATDSQNIPQVLSGGAAEVLHPTIPGAGLRAGDAAGFHDVTIIRNDYLVTGGVFGLAEGTNTALATLPLDGYCSVVWSASGPHQPAGLSGGLGADGGLHTDPSVFANLSGYVANGGFVMVTGHDAVANPDDMLLTEFVGGIGAASGQTFGPSLSLPFGNNALTLGPNNIFAASPVGGGINPVDGVQEQDYLVMYDANTSVVVTDITAGVTPPAGPAASWAVRHPGGPADEFINKGHVAYIANGVFLYEDLPTSPGLFLSDGEDASWVSSPIYRGALLNFAFNSCISLPFDAGEAPVANDQFVSTPQDVAVDIVLTGSDPNNDPLAFAIDVFPSNGALIGSPPTVTYTPNASYTGPDEFTFRVSDEDRTSEPGTVTIDVQPNFPPVADANGPYTVDEGGTYTLDASGSSDLDGDPLTFTWDINDDGVFGDATGPTPTLSAAGLDDSVTTVSVRVSDGFAEDTDSSTLTVMNVAPTVDAGPDAVINEGDMFLSSGTFTDAGALDTWTAVVDYGDGSSPQALVLNPDKTFDLAHMYADNGDYVATVTVTDDDGGVGSDSALVTVFNVAPTVSVNVPIVTVNEGDIASNSGTFADVGADVVTMTASVGGISQTGTQSGTWSWAFTTQDGPDQSQTVTITATDSDLAATSTTFELSVLNVPPVAADDTYSIAEDTLLAVAAPGVLANDTDAGLDSLSATVATPPSKGNLTLNPDGSFSYAPNLNYFGPDSFTYTVTDDDGATDTALVTIEVTPVNDPPVLSVDVNTQIVQYSDGISAVTITAADVDDVLPLSSSLSSTVLPASLSIVDGVCSVDTTVPAGTGSSCFWTLSGNATVGAGTYPVTFTVTDAAADFNTASTEIVVVQEDATGLMDIDNPSAVIVTADGSDSSVPFSLAVHVSERLPDLASSGLPAAGDIGLAEVGIDLVPVGPGTSFTGAACTRSMIGTGYSAVLTVACDFAGVPVNTYSVVVTIDGDYYTGGTEDVVTVYDPSLGFATGGGWFYWPDTMDKTTYGFTMKYGKNGRNVKGNLLVIRHMADGSIYRFKSNALEGLAVGESTSPAFGWASFSGKGTYKEPTWDDPIGNHTFTAYVEDRSEPGAGADRFWIEVRDKSNLVLPGLSIDPQATDNAVTIGGGNIVVPHASKGK